MPGARPHSLRTNLLRALSARAGDASAIDAAIALAIRLGGAALTFVTQILVARWLGISEFGAFANAWVWITLLGTVTQAGFASTATRFARTYRAQDDRAALHGLVLFSQLFVFALGLLATAGVAVVAGHPLVGYSEPQREALLAGSLCIPLFAQIEVGKGLSRVSGLASLAYLPGMLLRPALFLAFLAAAVAAGVVADATAAILTMLGALSFAWIAQAVIVRRRTSPLIGATGATWPVRPWLAAGPGVVVTEGYGLFVASIDIILLNLLATGDDAAMYFAAAKTAALASYVQFAVSATAQGRFATLVAQSQWARLSATARKYAAWTLWPTIAAGAVIAASGETILGLFGDGFDAAVPVLAVLVLGHCAHAAAGPVRVLLIMAGRHNSLAGLLAATAVLCTALNLLLIPAFGAMGAAVAFLMTSICAPAAMVGLARVALGLWCVPPLPGLRRSQVPALGHR